MDFGKGPERVKILRATLADGVGKPGEILDESPRIACGFGALTLVEVQKAGRGPVSGGEFFRGARLAVGASLSETIHAAL